MDFRCSNCLSPLHIKHFWFANFLGAHSKDRKTVAEQHVITSFFKTGEAKIELLESTSEDGPIARFIEKRGEGIHHIAMTVPDLPAAIEGLKASGARILNEPRKGAGGHLYSFIHPASTGGVLLELIQE